MRKINTDVLDQFERVHTFRNILYRIKAWDRKKEKIKKIELGKDGIFLISDVKKIKKAIEGLDNFGGWANFNDTWDIMWVGLDIRYAIWIIGRHNSPVRQIIHPVRLIKKFKGNIVQQARNSAIVQDLPIPDAILKERAKMFKSPTAMKQLEMDEKVTEFLTSDTSAEITKQATKDMLNKQLKELDGDD